jgi:hypothetical protein
MVLTALGVAGAGLLGLFVPKGEGQGNMQNIEVFSVDGRKVTLGQVNEQADRMRSQFGLIADPTFEFQFLASAIRSLVDQSLLANMASERGVMVDENYALRVGSEQIDAAIVQGRAQMISSGALKADATEAEFQAAFEKQTGMTTAEFKEKSLQELKDSLADPAKRDSVLGTYSQTALEENFAATAEATEEEVKKSYESMSFLTIAFDKQDMGLPERTAQAAQAMAELRAGADFLTVQKKYMATPSSEPVQYNRIVVENDPVLKPLANLKVGDFSEPIVEFGAIPRIYKLTAVKSELPDDFATNKAVYTEAYRRQKAGKLMNDALTEAREQAKIEWKSPGYEAIYKVATVNMDGKLAPDQIKSELRAIIENTEVSSTDPAGTMPAMLARYSAVQSLEFHLNDAEKKALAETKIQVINDVLAGTEHIPLRLELVDTYELLGQNEMAADELLLAAQNNMGLDLMNQTYFESINTKLVAMETSKTISEEKAQLVRAELLRWSKEKAEADRLQKEQEAELDKFTVPDPAEEAAKKALEEANKPKETTTTGGN